MLKTIKTFTRNLIIGANVATVIMMLLVGYSGRLNPESFPILSNACLAFPIFLVINVFFLFFWLLFYPKGALVSLLGIIISYVPVRTYCPLNLKSEKPVGCIKVMTYNVDGSMKKETDAQGRVTYPALEYIGASGADVVCVQEAYMTSLSLKDRENFEKMAEGSQDRELAGKESKLLMEKLAEASKIRAPQAGKVATYIRNHSHYPIIVCGDFNDNPLSYVHHTIAEGLTDCFVATGNWPGWTFNHNRIRVRIDHILCSKDIVPYQCHVDSKINVSDHHPVSCWLKN